MDFSTFREVMNDTGEKLSFLYKNAINGGALENIDTQIHNGQVALLCGESVSGKTTFSRLVSLIPTYYDGETTGGVFVQDEDARNVKIHDIASIVVLSFKITVLSLLMDKEIVFANC